MARRQLMQIGNGQRAGKATGDDRTDTQNGIVDYNDPLTSQSAPSYEPQNRREQLKLRTKKEKDIYQL